jgi:hypothetical protein
MSWFDIAGKAVALVTLRSRRGFESSLSRSVGLQAAEGLDGMLSFLSGCRLLQFWMVRCLSVGLQAVIGLDGTLSFCRVAGFTVWVVVLRTCAACMLFLVCCVSSYPMLVLCSL